jgi:hypothetical protein
MKAYKRQRKERIKWGENGRTNRGIQKEEKILQRTEHRGEKMRAKKKGKRKPKGKKYRRDEERIEWRSRNRRIKKKGLKAERKSNTEDPPATSTCRFSSKSSKSFCSLLFTFNYPLPVASMRE